MKPFLVLPHPNFGVLLLSGSQHAFTMFTGASYFSALVLVNVGQSTALVTDIFVVPEISFVFWVEKLYVKIG